MKKIATILMALSIVFSSASLVSTENKNYKAEAKAVTETSSIETTTQPTSVPTITTESSPEEIIPYKPVKITTVASTTKTTVQTTESTTKIQWEETSTTKKEIITYKNEPTTEKSTAEVISPNGKNLGKFKITVYTPSSDGGRWGYQTATGVTSQHLKTCAVDPEVIPLGSTIRIGNLTLLACDTGNKVKGNVIDIFYDGNSSEACKWVSNFGTSQYVYAV